MRQQPFAPRSFDDTVRPAIDQPTVLLIGTADTKSDELAFMRERLASQDAKALLMDVGVLAAGHLAVDITHDDVANAAGCTLQSLIEAGDENAAMTTMALGAARIAAELHATGRVDGLLALGGTMGTDLALQVASALPLGCPKVIVSTIAHSHLIPPERIAPDLMMLLWAGGLYGLNSLCRSTLSQGCGAVVGAVRAVRAVREGELAWPAVATDSHTARPAAGRPLIGITSLGTSCLAYVTTLKPALEARGYEVAVFHTTGMGGRAFEALAATGQFAAVMDFSLQELANQVGGSVVSAGADRLTGAGRSGTPQIVAPGAVDMIDFAAWAPLPAVLAGRPVHVHNRLIASATSAPALRQAIAQQIGQRLALANGPSCLLLPLHGIEQWDRPGEPLHDGPGLQAFITAMRAAVPAGTRCIELAAHINDAAFCVAALQVLDEWVVQGKVVPGRSMPVRVVPGEPPNTVGDASQP